MSGPTPVPGSALHRHPQCTTTDHARLPLSDLPSGQTQVQGLPKTLLPEQPAVAQTPSPAAVSAPGDCRATGWLSYMFKYLPHRRRICDEPNHAHPPAAPTAREWKHPLDARQQLCPQVSRRVSCPRGTKSVRTVFGRGALLPAPSFRPACATTSARHGELGASSPK